MAVTYEESCYAGMLLFVSSLGLLPSLTLVKLASHRIGMFVDVFKILINKIHCRVTCHCWKHLASIALLNSFNPAGQIYIANSYHSSASFNKICDTLLSMCNSQCSIMCSSWGTLHPHSSHVLATIFICYTHTYICAHTQTTSYMVKAISYAIPMQLFA